MSDIDIYAHRGTNPYPDHSREAHVWGVNWGADVIEPDLWLTKDGVLVVSHDNHNYSNLTYEEAKALEPALQTFGEVIEIVKTMSIETGRSIGIIPETKSTDYATSEAVVKELIAHEFTDPDRVVIQSFSSANLQMLNDTIMPQYGLDIPLAFLGATNLSTATLEQVAAYADIIAPHQSLLTAEGVAAAHALGLEVVTWTITGTRDQIQRLVDLNVDGVFVDETNTARESISNINNVTVAYGTEGDDEISGTAGDDLAYGMKGDDTISLGDGNDVAYGDAGDDVIDGEAGNDVLFGGSGDDDLAGGEGDDVLVGGVGDDVLDGGDGIDTVSYLAGLSDTTGVTVDLSTGSAYGDEAGADELVGIENVIGGKGDDTLTGDDAANVLDGSAGNDTIDGGAGDDTLKGGAGDDTIAGGAGVDTLDLSDATGAINLNVGAGTASGAGIGTDTFSGIEAFRFGAGDDVVTGGNGNDVFDGGLGNDTLKGGAGDDLVAGGAGNDNVDGGSGDDSVSGGIGNDTLKGGSGNDLVDGGEGDDLIDAGSGDDVITAGAGNDTVDAGSGVDRIEGGAGDDLLKGGSGGDTFVFAQGFGHDVISDFATSGASADVLEFSIDIFADFAAAMASAVQVGSDVVFTIDEDTTLTLDHTKLATLGADDFRFV
ncbi:glycerophosphodiester phosphodiesterase family protein [Flaviflagellibacter deserti]|uniref:Glycerophosphodiester phosphodiesterase family protein n=1 Tax=Flaviflagellibacter deserti TaxID=2267266 RepID=A0ABV9Z3G6_9HYPH